jgi:hypothetical protein
VCDAEDPLEEEIQNEHYKPPGTLTDAFLLPFSFTALQPIVWINFGHGPRFDRRCNPRGFRHRDSDRHRAPDDRHHERLRRLWLPPLPPALYSVKVVASGFAAFEQSNVALAANQSLNVSARLKVGTASETVEVEGANRMGASGTIDGAYGPQSAPSGKP